MQIFAHRGLLGAEPAPIENSMRALAGAVSEGFSIETDFRFGRDRQIVVFHDADLRRIFGDSRPTDQIDADQLKTLYELKSGLAEPANASLEALLAWSCFGEVESPRQVLVNIKEPRDLSFVSAVCETIVAAGRQDSSWLFDMDQALIPDIHRAQPDVRLLARLSHLEGEGLEVDPRYRHARRGSSGTHRAAGIRISWTTASSPATSSSSAFAAMSLRTSTSPSTRIHGLWPRYSQRARELRAEFTTSTFRGIRNWDS